jgi:ribosomal protein S18 acetylase RimI-like enzyme
MIQIRPIQQIADEEARTVTGSYTCTSIYRVQYSDDDGHTRLELTLEALPQPVTRVYEHFDAETIAHYNSVVQEGFSWGAYAAQELVGFLIAEQRAWNASLWVWEFHVAAAYRRQGIGRGLMDQAVQAARAASLRTIICETQNRNAPAIQVYRRLGFGVEGIDISYYTNNDYPDRDVAVFMKRRL